MILRRVRILYKVRVLQKIKKERKKMEIRVDVLNTETEEASHLKLKIKLNDFVIKLHVFLNTLTIFIL